MTVYAVMAYGKTVYTELLEGLFIDKAVAEKCANDIKEHLNKSGIVYDVKVEKMTVDKSTL
jgi:hypothetical protein